MGEFTLHVRHGGVFVGGLGARGRRGCLLPLGNSLLDAGLG